GFFCGCHQRDGAMIIVTKPDITEPELDHLRERVEALGLRTHVSRGEQRIVVGCIGDEERLEGVALLSIPGVDRVVPVLKPYKLAAREFTAQRSVVRVGQADIGGPELAVIAGPCSVEDAAMLRETAAVVKRTGGRLLRGGAFKPRTSPYSF